MGTFATKLAARLTLGVLAAAVLPALSPATAHAAKVSNGGRTGTKDTTPPSVSISSPSSGATVGTSPSVSGSASDNVGVAYVQVSVDGGTYATATGTTSWSYTVSSLSGGSHTITAKAVDGAGNSSTASVSVSVSVASNATPPTSTIVSPRYDDAVISGPYTLSGSSSDSTYAIVREEWDVDGVAVATGTSPTGLTYAWDTTQATAGTHTLTYRSWNSAGAEGDASRPVTVGSATVKRVAVILYNFQNQTPPTTPQTVADWTFSGSRSIAGYYKEQSFGRLLLGGQYTSTGDVFGFYTVPYDYPTAPCDFTPWETSAMQQASAAGVNLSGYDAIVLTAAVPAGCGTGYGGDVQDRVPWNGFATADAWIAFAGHELGHTFGIKHHAQSWSCTDSSGHAVQISGTCTASEFGDPYDIMGQGHLQHMNVFDKAQLGLFRSGNIQTVTTAGTYTLAPSTLPSGGVQVIRIPRSYDTSGNPTDWYYLEYRQPTPYDVLPNNVVDFTGVQVREGPDYTQPAAVPHLIDTTPGSETTAGVSDMNDADLVPGHWFQDSASGVSITTVSAGSSGATVTISFGTPQCVHVAPTASLSPASQTGTAGQTLYYTLTVANNDSPACGASSFTVTPAIPAGFNQSPASMSVVGLYPAGTVTQWSVMLTSSTSQQPSAYSFSETASEDATGLSGSVSGTANVQ